ncbi:hypothetical protein LNQ03_27080 [Klebsiella pneumoniae subsp. pneumoniae]|nr:hypothetical protein [Klebsiella pneumoniae subsp. pneumoniae]
MNRSRAAWRCRVWSGAGAAAGAVLRLVLHSDISLREDAAHDGPRVSRQPDNHSGDSRRHTAVAERAPLIRLSSMAGNDCAGD